MTEAARFILIVFTCATMFIAGAALRDITMMDNLLTTGNPHSWFINWRSEKNGSQY